MEAELVALATAGATALVQQLVGETWEQVRGRVTAFFARRAGTDPETVGAELETVRAELLAAEESGDEQATADAQAEARTEWRARMRRTLQADPAAAAELRALLGDLMPALPAPVSSGDVHNTISGGVQHGAVIQAGSIGRLDLNSRGR
ncbi:hypothetical protein QWM81_15070 [Streptomyces ficellus]|uniref:Uncharacterized protein n=1 Tax=Streptomyces ficellus TaxID=1977088 RepID=A0ABT7Z778_9ACTN|nr:hypothetical protein [Streptomyces ficellus]MDN3295350.1 hypothetical protein [Streptomyces ficellus]